MRLAIPKGNGVFHLLSNKNLKIGDKVFPLTTGYTHHGKYYVLDTCNYHNNSYSLLACTGWPDQPHTIISLFQEDGLPRIQTDKGEGPAACYFKEIK